ncbi:hypothetical protein HOV23_gp049 [Pseudomonas phage Lana]|uniref:Uncharacterized protein n=1 Tax=Pseudomonas phage Lana TaxID=2530172 RepID=A0A481W605_9CAUD|nr:hypothetical protein HOV23_gp049 [Pseudomonas phage Lana]QBJ04524.1 hypothetical protein [Pseudomonas phage Lana]
MALKRAAAPTEDTTKTAAATAAEAVKETVKEVETAAVETQAQVQEEPVVETQQQAEAEDVQTAAEASATEQPAAEAEPVAEAAAKPAAAAEVQPEERATNQVAVKPEGGAVQVSNTERQANAAQKFSQEMAEQGFEGLNLTGMSFDRVKLAEGTFQLGSEEVNLTDTINVNILSTRNIYIVRQFAGDGAELYYSYDKQGLTLSDGSSAQEIRDTWLEEGYGTPDEPLDIKEYIEAMAQLKNREDEYDEHMVSLSIPPASKDRLAGAIAVGVRKHLCAPGELILQCKVGKKVGSGEKAFRPWNFSAVGRL